MGDQEWKARTGQKIEKLYAWVAAEEDGGEGIIAVHSPVGPVPAIGADRERIEGYRPSAVAVSQMMGCPVRLKMFSTVAVIDEV